MHKFLPIFSTVLLFSIPSFAVTVFPATVFPIVAKAEADVLADPIDPQLRPAKLNPQGIFQHLLPESKGSKIELQNFLGRLYINFEGVEYLGEHGVGHYFYAGYAQLMDDGGFSFDVPARILYTAPVRSGTFLIERGRSAPSIQFSGKIEDGKLVMSCQSEDPSACFDKTFILQRIE